MGKILDGKALANKIIGDIHSALELRTKPLKVNIAIIQYNDDPASDVYVRNKIKKFKTLGWNYQHIKVTDKDIKSDCNKMPFECIRDHIIDIIEKLNKDKSVTGIFVQMPIGGLDQETVDQIVNKIDPHKDVDGFTKTAVDGWTKELPTEIDHQLQYCRPCTPNGIIKLLLSNNIDIAGKNIVIIGRSMIVGKPVATMMLNQNATVTICHSKTKNLSFYTRNADIIISAVGKARLITGMMIKPGCVLVDVGITRENGNIVGDVHPECYDIASYYTPVPGGVGPMTIAMLCENVYRCAKYWDIVNSISNVTPIHNKVVWNTNYNWNNLITTDKEIKEDNQLGQLTKALNQLNDRIKN